jgi:hypothetical protein
MSFSLMWLVIYEFVRQVIIGFAVTFGPSSVIDQRNAKSALGLHRQTDSCWT